MDSTNNKPTRQNTGRTLFLLAVCGIVAFIVLVIQLYKVMIIDHDRYQSQAVEQQVRETSITASRGTIYDTNMKMLAVSSSVDTIYISPVEMLKNGEDPEFIAQNLSEMLGVDYDVIMAKWKHTDSWYETVAKKVEKEVSDRVLEFKTKNKLTSVHLIEDSKRYYPYSTLAAQVIGFVGGENTGLEGVEAGYESTLRGTNGRIVRATTSSGSDMKFTGYENYYDAVDGASIVLTIDSTVQFYLEKHLSQAIEDFDLQNGAMGIVMDVNTGAVLGMATLPEYDLNNFLTLDEETTTKLLERGLSNEEYDEAYRETLQKLWRNRTIADTYEPGSTFKIITLAAALEDGITTESETFDCKGEIWVRGRDADDPLKCWKTEGHGVQTLAEAAQHSCNVAFVTLGLRLGQARFYEYMDSFGFFDRTNIDLSGESYGIWWSTAQFTRPNSQAELAAASFGQTFNITPIQLITAVSAVANGGYLMEPYVVRQTLDSDGNVIYTHEPKVVRQVISEETSRRCNAILETVVSAAGATGKNAYVPGYRIAGKTGTGTKTAVQAETGEKEYWVSFIGYAPANDPQVAVLVVLDTPSDHTNVSVSGGAMAAPVVGSVLSDVLSYLGVEPDYSGANANAVGITMPSLRDYSVSDAQEVLRALGFDVKVMGSGSKVVDQAPSGGQKVNSGAAVLLYTEGAKPGEMVEVPNLFGMTYAQARANMTALGLYLRSTGVAPGSTSGANIIVSRQSVEAGSRVPFGSVIEVYLIDNDASIMEGAGQ